MSSIHDPRYAALIERLTALRKVKGVTQAQLAKKLPGFGQPDIAKVEGLQRRLDVIELIDWLEALDQPVNLFDVLDDLLPPVGHREAARVRGLAAGSEFIPLAGTATDVTNGVCVTMGGQGITHEVVFEGAKLDDYLDTEREVERLIRSLNDGSLGLKNREAIARALDYAMRRMPAVNPSDLYRHLVYRLYIREYTKTKANQSWVRAGGEALELFIEDWYRDRLAAEGIEIKALLKGPAQSAVLVEMGIDGHVGEAKLDIALYGVVGDRRIVFGGLHSKASLAERVADDVPCSRAMMRAGYTSVLWTFDAKDYPPRDLTNRGELGTVDAPTTKRQLIERDGEFDAAFVYNTRAQSSPAKTKSNRRIIVASLDPASDLLPAYLIKRWEAYKKTKGL